MDYLTQNIWLSILPIFLTSKDLSNFDSAIILKEKYKLLNIYKSIYFINNLQLSSSEFNWAFNRKINIKKININCDCHSHSNIDFDEYIEEISIIRGYHSSMLFTEYIEEINISISLQSYLILKTIVKKCKNLLKLKIEYDVCMVEIFSQENTIIDLPKLNYFYFNQKKFLNSYPEFEIIIKCPNLEYLEILGNSPINFLVEPLNLKTFISKYSYFKENNKDYKMLTSLDLIEIGISSQCGKPEYDLISKIFKCNPNLKKLKIFEVTRENLDYILHFKFLEFLTIGFHSYIRYSIDSIILIIKNCKNLKHLILEKCPFDQDSLNKIKLHFQNIEFFK